MFEYFKYNFLKPAYLLNTNLNGKTYNTKSAQKSAQK
jgi:hypothetical protein